jgi:hypothetical protein
MTQDEIIEMARQAGFERVIKVNPHTGIKTIEAYAHNSLERFAKLVAAKEREVCATLCIDEVWASTVQGTAVDAFNYASRECANRIRARGESWE